MYFLSLVVGAGETVIYTTIMAMPLLTLNSIVLSNIHIRTYDFKKLPMKVLIKLILSVPMIRLWIYWVTGACSRHVGSDCPHPLPIVRVKLQVWPGRRLAIKHHLNSIVSLSLVYCIKSHIQLRCAHTRIGKMVLVASSGGSRAARLSATMSGSWVLYKARGKCASVRPYGGGTRQFPIPSSLTGRSETGRWPHRYFNLYISCTHILEMYCII